MSSCKKLKRGHITRILLLLGALAAFHANSRGQDAHTMHVARGENFTLQLPDDWKEIPTEVLDHTFDAVVKMAPGLTNNHYEYGYQLASAGNTLTYPYVLVSVKKTGRIPESQVAKLPTTDQALKKGVGKAADQLKSMLSNVELGKPVYDPHAHALFLNSTMDINGIGPVKCLSAVYLTEQGSITMHCYSRTADYDDYAKTFGEIVKSVQLSDSIRYQSRITDSVPGLGGLDLGRIGNNAIIGGIIGGVAGALIVLFKKRKTS
jgi:hypothetical protein